MIIRIFTEGFNFFKLNLWIIKLGTVFGQMNQIKLRKQLITTYRTFSFSFLENILVRCISTLRRTKFL